MKINREKSKILRVKTTNKNPITAGGEPLEDVDKFSYLGSIINKQGGVEEDVKTRIQKARLAFISLTKIWACKTISRKTKIRLFNSNVKTVLLYGSETWRMTKSTQQKLQSFTNRCLRRILGIRWPDIISNADLHERTQQQTMEQLTKRKWRWIGHTLRRPEGNIARTCLRWNPQGKRLVGRSQTTRRIGMGRERKTKKIGRTWRELDLETRDRVGWRSA